MYVARRQLGECGWRCCLSLIRYAALSIALLSCRISELFSPRMLNIAPVAAKYTSDSVRDACRDVLARLNTGQVDWLNVRETTIMKRYLVFELKTNREISPEFWAPFWWCDKVRFLVSES